MPRRVFVLGQPGTEEVDVRDDALDNAKVGRSRRSARAFVVLAGVLPLLAHRPSLAAAGATDATARRAYYAVRYPGEQGPFARHQEAVDAALRALGARAESENWWTEWLTLITRDRYGKWWYSPPKEGQVLAARQCQVSYSIREVARPGSTLVSTAHTHPRGDLFPDPRGEASPDNQNPHEMFLLRSDGDIWFFRPHETRPKLYGRLAGEAIESRYLGDDFARLRKADDPEAIRPGDRRRPSRS